MIDHLWNDMTCVTVLCFWFVRESDFLLSLVVRLLLFVYSLPTTYKPVEYWVLILQFSLHFTIIYAVRRKASPLSLPATVSQSLANAWINPNSHSHLWRLPPRFSQSVAYFRTYLTYDLKQLHSPHYNVRYYVHS